jgi:hypothetical protein
LTDTTIDYKTGVVTAGDSITLVVRADDANFRAFEGGTGAGQAIWFDTAAWGDTATLSAYADNDSSNTTLRVFTKTWLAGAGHSGFNSGIVSVDSGSHDFTRTLSSTTNDSQFVITPALLVACQGLKVTFTFYHDTIKTTLDSAWAAKPDSVTIVDSLSHKVAGWTYKVWRGGNITDSTFMTGWIEHTPGLHNDFFFRVFKLSNLDSTMVKAVVYTLCDPNDTSRRVPVCSLTAADTTTELANWVHFPQMSDGDSAIAKGGHLCRYYQVAITVTDSNSVPAAYGTYTTAGIQVVKKRI